MADNTIALQTKTPDMLGTIGNMLNAAQTIQAIKQGGVNLEKSQRTLESDVAQRAYESQRSGTEARVSAETAGPRINVAAQESNQADIATNLARYKLNGTEAAIGRDATTALIQHPAVVNGDPDGILSALQQQKQAMIDQGLPPAKAEAQYVHAAQLALQNPKGFRQFLASTLNVGLGAQGQAGQNLVPASGQQQVGGADTSQNPTVMSKDQFGAVQQTPLPVAAPQGGQAPAGTAPSMRIPAGETPGTQAEMQDLRSKSNALAQQAPTQHFNNQQILRLAPEAFTGTGTGMLTKVMNGFGLQSTNDVGADTSQLQHFLALQVEQNAQAQGANTDAARHLAEQATLPGQAPEKAIKAITKVNDAYVTGNELFNQGLESAIKTSPKGVFAARDFRNAWSQAMDPRIFQIENAVKAGDTAEVKRIKDQLGPQGVAQLRQKAAALKALIGAGNGP